MTLLKLITEDEMGVDKLRVDKMGVDEMGSRRSGNKPFALFENYIIYLSCLQR